MSPTYFVKMQPAADVRSAEKTPIDKTVWLKDYCPPCSAQLVYDTSRETFIVSLSCQEANPLIRYHNFNDPVYTDSCLEWFCGFDPNDVRYINFEMNAGGALLAGFGADRHERISLHELVPMEEIPTVKAERTDKAWSVTLEIKKSTLEKVYGRPLSFQAGMTLRGNFYKCGDETEIEHYVMWSPIEQETPDYHVPKFFGNFVLCDK